MILIDEIVTSNGRRLQILKGDLADIPGEHKVDALVVSAFPNDYSPTRESVITALHNVGISVDALARDKESDLRSQFSCWISKEFNKRNIERIICFEPVNRTNPYSLIAGTFEGIMHFSLQFDMHTIAMPLVLTGNQGFDEEKVAQELISTSMFWLNKESPLKTIKIVVNTDAKAELVKKELAEYLNQTSLAAASGSYDFFISYSRQNLEMARAIQDRLQGRFNLFFDKDDIDVGANWLNKINSSLENSKRFIVCLSPDYIASKVCKYEYTFCNLKLIMDGDDCVLPVYLYSATLPFHMQILNYHDAREGQMKGVEEFCEMVIRKYG